MKKTIFLLLLFNGIVNGQIINFTDPDVKAALLNANASNYTAYGASGYTTVDTNTDGEIQVAEAEAILGVSFSSTAITDLGGLEFFSNLASFGCYNCAVDDFSFLNGMTTLTSIGISNNMSVNTSFTFSDLPSLTAFSFYYSNLTSLTINNCAANQVGIWGDYLLTSLQINNMPQLTRVWGFDCALQTISISNAPLINEMNFNDSNFTSFPAANFPALKKLYLSGNQISDVSGFTGLNQLEELNLQNNQILNFNLPPIPTLRYLWCGSNGFPTANLTGYPQLRVLAINNNNLSNLNLSANTQLQQLIISQNQLSSIDVTMLSDLTSIDFGYNLFSEMDLSGSPLLNSLSFTNNPNLTHINLKSGQENTINYSTSGYFNLPVLQYICIDEGDTFTFSLLSTTPDVTITPYCSFVPGGDFNTITGVVRYDANANGCDSGDAVVKNFRMDMTQWGINSATFTNPDGEYTFYTTFADQLVSPHLENPEYFTVTPADASISFPDLNQTAVQDFCIAPNGNHQDLEIVISPVTPARPGFNATYKIVYRNKGTVPMTQQYGINLSYNQNLMTYVTSSEVPSNQGVGSLNWDYADLQPFESRMLLVSFLVNSPTAPNPVTIGDVLTLSSTVSPQNNDEQVQNNIYILNQTVVGSYDPNDISCIEGDNLPDTEIGKYLHYMVNFENTGNYIAENVVLKLDINPTQYDISTLQLLENSHPVYTRITNNKAEFIFEGINLAALGGNPPVGGHGNVLFKIKSLNSLNAGDTVANRASIFFDYNDAVITNVAETLYSSLQNDEMNVDESLSISPNPAVSSVSVTSKHRIQSIEMYDVQGRIVQKEIAAATQVTVDISRHQSGIYFLKITSDTGYKVLKLVKE